MLGISRRIRIVLDLLFAITVVSALFSAADVATRVATWRGLIVSGLVCIAAAAWVLWRRGLALRWAVPALVAAAGAATLIGDGAGTLPLFFLGIAVLVVDRGTWAGVMATGALMAAAVLVMTFIYHRHPADVVRQSVGTAMALGLGLLLGQLLREIDQARQLNQRLLVELHESWETQKDHVLAQERARAAADLHDGLGHQLTAIGLSLEYAERVRPSDAARADAELGHAKQLAEEALARMRLWVRALDPVSVGTLTGTDAFEAIADNFRDTGLRVDVHTNGGEPALSQDAAMFLLRVVQEGLTNALRHGSASTVTIDLSTQGDTLTLALRDDGFSPGGDISLGYGLRSLTERAERLGGSVHASRESDGFILTAHLPLRSKQ